MKRAAIALLLFATKALAADRGFLISAGLATAANIADGITTVKCGQMPDCREAGSPWLYGAHPTSRSYYLPSLSIQAVQALIAWRLWQSNNRFLRRAAKAQLWIAGAGHFSGFVWNASHGF